MIQFKPLQPTNLETLVLIANDLGVQPLMDAASDVMENEYRCFLALDGDQTIGYCLFQMRGNGVAHLMQIYIKPEERNFKLGDGLFRSVLNSLELNGVNRVIASGTSEEIAFYNYEGFTDSDSHNVVLESIAAFFSKPCKGHKK